MLSFMDMAKSSSDNSLLSQIKEQKIRFRYNLGSGEEMVFLAFVNVSDGQWHTVNVKRLGKSSTIKLDGGEGRYYNRTEGSWLGHLHINVAPHSFFAGGDVKFPAHNVPAIVDYDYRDSKFTKSYILHFMPYIM